MLRSIVTLDLPSATIAELQKKGVLYVEDLLKNEDCLKKFNLNKAALEKQLQVPEVSALDVWQNESQRECISICCSDLEAVLGNGFQCGTITELSGAPFTGKTQICMQLCISVQLNKCHGGLNGRAIYIDTRSGSSALRIRDMVQGYNKLYADLNLTLNEVLNNIHLFPLFSIEDLMEVVDNLKEMVKIEKNNKKVRLIVVDSLSMLILCCIDDQLKRPYYFSKILNELHKLALRHDLAVIVTNEIVTQVDKDGTPYFAAAGGQHVADYAHVKLELTRLANEKFATRLVKSPIMPEVSVTFKITEDGIRNFS